MREKQIEQTLVQGSEGRGGMCPKLVSPGTDGCPTGWCLLPDAASAFVEVKAPGQKPRPCRTGGMNN